jgi:aminopeptidase N
MDGAVAPAQYLDIIEAVLPGETDLAVESTLKRAAYSWLGTYLPESEHRARLTRIAGTILAESAPGSNRQLVAVRALVELTRDLDLLSRWRSGESPEGMRVDDDFRWRVLRALCAAGAATQADVEAESRRDPSSQGALHALACTSARPDPDGKAAVWNRIMTDETLTNYEAYALAQHFFKIGQEDVTASYVPMFFTDLPPTAAFRHGAMAEDLTILLFPRLAVSDATVALADACLATSLDPGVRRAIADQTDDMRRVLKARSRFH